MQRPYRSLTRAGHNPGFSLAASRPPASIDRSIARNLLNVGNEVQEALRTLPTSGKLAVRELLSRTSMELVQVRRIAGTGAYVQTVSPERRQEYLPDIRSNSRPLGPEEKGEVERGWKRILEEGRSYRSEALQEIGPVLSPGEVARRLGVTPVTVNNWRRQGKLLAVRLDGHQYLYPEWQFVQSPSQGERGVLRHLDEILETLGGAHPWEKARFFLVPQPALQGKTVLQVLRAGTREEIERARRVAATYGEMGT